MAAVNDKKLDVIFIGILNLLWYKSYLSGYLALEEREHCLQLLIYQILIQVGLQPAPAAVRGSGISRSHLANEGHQVQRH